MKILVVSALFGCACVVPVRAQSAVSTGTPAAHDSRAQAPLVAGVRLPTADGKQPQIVMLPPPKNSVCYVIRSYNFAPSTPGSDATMYKDSTTCQVASNAHMKGAVAAGQR